GIVEWSPQVVQDDDAALGNQVAVVTPALTRRLETCCAYYSYVSLHLDGEARHEAAIVAAVNKVLPNLGPAGGSSTWAPYVAKAERAIRPEAIALAVFGLIAALAALVINGQVISRLVRRNAEEGAIVRALGAGPAMAMADGLAGVVGSIVLGSLLAVAVAVALSPLAPIGPVRSVYPDIGVAFDWAVLGFGLLVFVVLLTAAALFVAYRVAPHRLAHRGALPDRDSVWKAAATAGLPPSAVLGIRSALGSRAGRDAAPVRSALLGAVVAVTVIVTSLTFASSLNALVSQPPLYGWNWDYALLAGFSAAENLPAAQTAALLDHDPDVAHWAGVSFENVDLDEQSVPVLAMSPGAAVSPSMLSGHALAGPSQVVLGPATLSSLHTHVGDTVTAKVDGHTRLRLHIVGTATLPTIGGSGSPDLEMGTGAVMAASLFSATDLDEQGSPVAGPMAVFISVRSGVSDAAALGSLNHITAVLNRSSDPDAPVGGVVSALRPAEIANYRSISATPALLATVLAAGAVGALGLTLVASVRQRRRQFALLKALGFTHGQIAASVAWQSSVAAVVGVVLGVPIGIALGRWMWTLFADGISAVPHPTVPVASIAAVALGAIVFANLVALLPGRVAARTRTSLLLRAE
ncbi:MAG: FtsX-like permease family protein, partial [Acidimicrobiales bacterium]